MQPGDLLALDANALRDWADPASGVDAQIGLRLPCLPCVVLEEGLRGWLEQVHRARQKRDEARLAASLKRLEEFHTLVRQLPILDYSPAAQGLFSQLGAGRGNRDRNDLRIAAICLAHGVPLLTRNIRDFDDIPGLTVET